MVDFLYMMNWMRFMEEKWVRMAKSTIFWAKPVSRTDTKELYRYPLCRRQVVPVPLKVVLVPIGSRVLVPVPVQVVPVPMLPATIFLQAMHF